MGTGLGLVGTGWDWLGLAWHGWDWLGMVGIECAESHGPRRGLGKQKTLNTARMCLTAI